ncbi:amino acid ABC transporter permease [Cupriavidus basilensis]|uniref:Glutamate Aspartate transport system permease protein GltJ n=1 Tax=Cupriavidus basilensis TaxID=68895 RepID=A0A0C4YGI5_9BURK|nr:amino acid ABC transporter permease [Cupriavidus basilensis]AJG24972.1 Glutamate Aspartate transport system permease protein GltJ [Cupriavidus basilensis]
MQGQAILLQSLPAKYVGWIAAGFGLTVALSVAVFVLGCAIAAGWLVLARSPIMPLRLTARGAVGLLRRTPLLVQLFFWYFGAAQLLGEGAIGALYDWQGWRIGGWHVPAPSLEALASLAGIGLYASAFYARELEAGLANVPRGQGAAALALGFTPAAAFWRVVLPQALRIAARPMVGQFCQTIKNTSLAMAIGFAEMSYTARQVETDSLMTFQAFGLATLLYVALILLLQAAAPVLLRCLGWTEAARA